jgi:hypothetical protein
MPDGWAQGIALVILAVVLEALVDVLMDRWKIVKRGEKERHDRHSH